MRIKESDIQTKDIQDQKEKALNKKELTTEQNNIIKEPDILIKELNSLKAKVGENFAPNISKALSNTCTL